jgi:porin
MRRRLAVFSLLLLGSTSFASGFEFSAEYTADILGVVSGGLSAGTEYLDNLGVALEIDVAEAWSVGAGTILVHGLYNNRSRFSADRVGDLHVVSNIDADEAWRLFEAWYELADANWSVRAGLYDLNSEFDLHETGGIFLNSSHGIGAEFGQTGENGPSIFPVSSLALRGAMTIGPLTARAAVLDGVPGNSADPASNRIELGSEQGALAVSEIDVAYANSARLWLGYWRYSAEFDRIDDNGSGFGNEGWYIGTEAGFRLGSRAAAAFIRYGRADEHFNVLASYVGVGVVIAGPLDTRPADQLGIAVASARAGDPYRDHTAVMGERARRHETAWELTYRLRVNEYVVIQPDIQYVRNPSLSPGLDDAWVVGCRIQLGN